MSLLVSEDAVSMFFFIPATREAGKSTVKDRNKYRSGGNGETILFVEDNESIREILHQVLDPFFL